MSLATRGTYLRIVLLLALPLALTGCDTTSSQPPTLSEATGFAFDVDPQAETLTLIETVPSQLEPQYDPSDSRILTPYIDIGLRDLTFEFVAPNKLVVRYKLENLTEVSFVQPFFFTLNSESENFKRAYAPLVNDQQLGGDGVLSPGETSRRFYFEVTFKEGEPFTFLVDTSAVVALGGACRDPVVIPDENLEAIVRYELGRPSGDLTCEAMTELTELPARRLSISGLEGLQYALNLARLNLSENAVQDLTPLRGLTELTHLELYGNATENIGPLQKLVNLTYLDLSNNAISDIGPLQGLTKLTDLGLNSNNLRDLSALRTLTNLTRLWAVGNNISDLTPLQDLTKLRHLNLYVNNISDLAPLQDLTNLQWLGLGRNNISDLAPLQGLAELKQLRLENNVLREIGVLLSNSGLGEGDGVRLDRNLLSAQALEDVETLRARGVGVFAAGITCRDPITIPDANLALSIQRKLGTNRDLNCTDMSELSGLLISDARPVASLEGLQYAPGMSSLRLDAGTISDLTPLKTLFRLEGLYLSDHAISDLAPLADLTRLKTLELDRNGIGSVAPLRDLVNLISLDLEQNNVTDVAPISNLTALQTLVLNDNNITDIAPLSSLTALVVVVLANNGVTDVAPLETLTSLVDLDLANNDIGDISALVNNEGLGEGDDINLFGNPLSQQALEDVETLRARGVDVRF